jgi:tripartite-type tricarboxylate transporter receptor subunit TctC
MKMGRREFLQLAAGAVALPTVCRIDGARAQYYPMRPITMIVPGSAGGSTTDAIARIISERMRKSLAQPIIIENIGGADGSIAAGRAARAKPDGYTIDLGYLGNHVLNGAVYSLQYDLLNDFAPISPLVTTSGFLFARRTIPAEDLNELIAWLKTNPNKASMGVASMGERLINEWFRRETGTQYTLVPYRGGSLAVRDLAAGQIDLFFGTPDSGLTLARAGSMKYKGLCGDKRDAFGAGARTSDFCRAGTTEDFLVRLGWAFLAQRHAEGDRWQAQRRGRGRLGRSGSRFAADRPWV